MVLKDIASIIKNFMGLTDSQIWLKDEKLFQPTDNTFSITVGFMGLKSMGSSRSSSYGIVAPATVDTMNEVIGTNMTGTVVIDIMGRTFDVMTRKEEIIQAMKSSACKELQMKNGFLIGEIPTSMNDISGLDGSAIPYRFQATFQVQFLSVITKPIDYYVNFRSTAILTEE